MDCFFVLFLWCFFRICCSGVYDCGFLVCKVGIDKSVFVSFTDGVCLLHRWRLCMDGSAIFLGLDCAFWWLGGKCCFCERCRCEAMLLVKEVPPDVGFVLPYYDSMVCAAGGLCLGSVAFLGLSADVLLCWVAVYIIRCRWWFYLIYVNYSIFCMFGLIFL